MPRTKKRLSPKQQQLREDRVLGMSLEGWSFSEIAKKEGCSRATAYRWAKAAQERQEALTKKKAVIPEELETSATTKLEAEILATIKAMAAKRPKAAYVDLQKGLGSLARALKSVQEAVLAVRQDTQEKEAAFVVSFVDGSQTEDFVTGPAVPQGTQPDQEEDFQA